MNQLFKNLKKELSRLLIVHMIRKLFIRIRIFLLKWWLEVMKVVGDVRRRVAQYKAEEYHSRTGKKINVIDGRHNTAIMTRESRKVLKKTGVLKKSTTAIDVDRVSHQIIQQGKKQVDKKNIVKKRR